MYFPILPISFAATLIMVVSINIIFLSTQYETTNSFYHLYPYVATIILQQKHDRSSTKRNVFRKYDTILCMLGTRADIRYFLMVSRHLMIVLLQVVFIWGAEHCSCLTLQLFIEHVTAVYDSNWKVLNMSV